MCVMVVCCVLSRCVSSNVADCIIQYMCIGNESVRSGRVYRLERVYVCIRVSFKVLCLYHKCAPIWEQTLAEGTSGKAKEEMWKRFCYLLNCKRSDSKPEEITPKDFDWEKTEKQKWMYVFKWMGPPCEFLELGDKNATNSCPIRPNYQNAAQEPKNAAGISYRTSTQGRRQPKEPE